MRKNKHKYPYTMYPSLKESNVNSDSIDDDCDSSDDLN